MKRRKGRGALVSTALWFIFIILCIITEQYVGVLPGLFLTFICILVYKDKIGTEDFEDRIRENERKKIITRIRHAVSQGDYSGGGEST